MKDSRYKIVFTCSENEDKMLGVSENVLLIGRSRSCDVRFAYPDVSGRHIEIFLNHEGQVVLKNLSMRKTKVNGRFLEHEEVLPLKSKDKVVLGQDLSFYLDVAHTVEKTALVNDVTLTQNALKDETESSDLADVASAENTDSFEEKGGEEATCFDSKSTNALKQEVMDSLQKAPTFEDTVLNVSNEVVEEMDDKTVIAGPMIMNESSAVVAESLNEVDKDETATVAVEDDFKTMVQETLIASPEELERLRTSKDAGFARKVSVYFVGILIAGLIVGAGWIVSMTNQEKKLSWPVGENGKFDDEVIYSTFGAGNHFLVYFPRHDDMRVEKKNDEIFAETRVGRAKDVTLRFTFYMNQGEQNLTTTRKKGAEQWVEKKLLSNQRWNFDSSTKTYFKGKGNGTPYESIKYTRYVDDISWFGVASYMKYQDWELVILKEIPVTERWRGENLLDTEAMFSVSSLFTKEHWEFKGEELVDDTVDAIIAEVGVMLERNSAALWKNASNLLISGMIKSLRNNDLASYEKLKGLMKKLRENQTLWLNAKKLEYFNAKGKNRFKDAQYILNECRRMFSDKDDKRYDLIRSSTWN